jgi:cytosine/adenosine deaminase-related metal-dependent hydrolase
MLYRKFSADYIFTGYQLLGAGYVLITDAAGAVIEIIAAAEAGEGVQHFNGILSPGFINAHCHLELSHMRGVVPERTGLVDFVLKVVFGRDGSDIQIAAAIQKADDEMFQNGIVAVGDICNNLSTITQKANSRLLYHNFIEATGFPPVVATSRFQRSLDLYKQYKHQWANSSLVPHAPYSVSKSLFGMIDELAGNNILTIHNQETPAENELFQKGSGDFLRLYAKMNIDVSFFKPTGKTSLQSWLPLLKKYGSLILVHNVCSSEGDIQFEQQLTAERQQAAGRSMAVHYCICANANKYITGLLPDVNLLQQQGCSIVLGTDSLASNYQLSILEEMKTLQQYFPFLSTATLLQWATINGARALQLQHQLGSFEKGKKPGIVLLEGATGQQLSAAAVTRLL